MSLSTKQMRRFATAIAIVLVAFTAMVPAAAACCVQPLHRMASMHASMACCGESCKLTKNNVRPDHDYALTTARAAVGAVAVADVAISVAPLASSVTQAADAPAFASPPQFVAHHQYRI